MAASSGKNTRGNKGRASFAQRKVRYSWRNRLARAGAALKAAVDAGTMTHEAAISTMAKTWSGNRAEFVQHRRNWRG